MACFVAISVFPLVSFIFFLVFLTFVRRFSIIFFGVNHDFLRFFFFFAFFLLNFGIVIDLLFDLFLHGFFELALHFRFLFVGSF